MNTARIGTAVQGIAHAELSFQGALPYAKERMSMRALSGKKIQIKWLMRLFTMLMYVVCY